MKVTYTNGWRQKFKIKTVLSPYEKKILDELEPLLADPDNGLKKALILEQYFIKRMTYSMADKGSCSNELYLGNKLYKKLYNSTFKGVCQDGAVMANNICKLVGMKSIWTSCNGINHAWCNVYVTNKNGTSYWKGIRVTSYATFGESVTLMLTGTNTLT